MTGDQPTSSTTASSPAPERRIGVCNLCEAICGLELTVENNRVTGVRGNPKDPLSRGHICPKGVAIGDIQADPDRLRQPVRRRGSGAQTTWEEIGWDEAFDLVADGLAETINTHGPDALAIYLGNPNVHSLGSMTHGLQLVKALRTRNTFSATSVDQLPQQLLAHLMFGHQLLLPIPDIDRTSYFLMFGANPMASNGSLMTAPDFPARLRELKQRDGRLVLFDPRRTETARVASEHQFIKPGTDAHVLLAMLQVIFTEGLDRAPTYVRRLDRLRAAVTDFTPELAEQVSGVPADDVRRIAREFAQAETAVAYGRVGTATHEFGSVCSWATYCLNAVTGRLDSIGGAMFTSPAIDVVGSGLVGRGGHARWHSRVRGLPESAGEFPVAALREEITTPGDGQVRAMLTLSGNPVLSTPDGAALDAALDNINFMASVDFYINETTRHADVILPPTSALERDHYDLIFHALAVRNTTRFTPAAITPGENTRHDWQIYRELALRTTARLTRRRTRLKRVQTWLKLSVSPTRMIQGLLLASRSGVTLRTLRRQPSGVDLGPLQPGLFPGRLQTGDKQIDLAPDLVITDLDRLRTAAVALDQDTDGDGLLLIGRRHQRDCNSWMHNTDRLTRGKPRHQLFMNPADLIHYGLDDGAEVYISSRVGSVRTEVLSTEDVMPGVVSLPHGFGHNRPGSRMHRAARVDGVSINDLTDPGRLDVSGNAALSGVPVTVTPIADPQQQ